MIVLPLPFFQRYFYHVLPADIYISNPFSKMLHRVLRSVFPLLSFTAPLFEMRCVCSAKIKYSGSSSTIICGTEASRWENAEISAFSCYQVMKNVDKHFEEVRVSRSGLGTESRGETRENC